MKICSRCHIEKPCSDFIKCTHNKSGIGSWCKECAREYSKEPSRKWYAANKERASKSSKAYQAKNKVAVAVKKHIHYELNKSDIAKRDKLYRNQHKAELALKAKERHKNNRKRDIARSRQWYLANCDLCKQKAKEYYQANKEKHHKQSKAWAEANPEKRCASVRKYNHKYRDTLKGHLSSTISKRMNESLRKGMKAGRHWENLVSFTIDQLRDHLEKQFVEGMNWKNYGREGWHIDHRVPVAAFNFSTPDDSDFQRCWALENLQPLWAKENMSKGGKIDQSFQSSLIFGGITNEICV